MDLPDYYEILEVHPKASQTAVDRAYRGLARRYHPDAQPADRRAWATERMQAISQAYAVLSNPGRRAQYDLQYSARSVRWQAATTPPTVPAPAPVATTRPTAYSACSRHPSQPRRGACAICGCGLCLWCMTDVRGVILCPDCAGPRGAAGVAVADSYPDPHRIIPQPWRLPMVIGLFTGVLGAGALSFWAAFPVFFVLVPSLPAVAAVLAALLGVLAASLVALVASLRAPLGFEWVRLAFLGLALLIATAGFLGMAKWTILTPHDRVGDSYYGVTGKAQRAAREYATALVLHQGDHAQVQRQFRLACLRVWTQQTASPGTCRRFARAALGLLDEPAEPRLSTDDSIRLVIAIGEVAPEGALAAVQYWRDVCKRVLDGSPVIGAIPMIDAGHLDLVRLSSRVTDCYLLGVVYARFAAALVRCSPSIDLGAIIPGMPQDPSLSVAVLPGRESEAKAAMEQARIILFPIAELAEQLPPQKTNACTPLGITRLHLAALRGNDRNQVQELIQEGADPHARDICGLTPVDYAVLCPDKDKRKNLRDLLR